MNSLLAALSVTQDPLSGLSQKETLVAAYAIWREELLEVEELFPHRATLRPGRHRNVRQLCLDHLAELRSRDLVRSASDADLLWFVQGATRWLTQFHEVMKP